MTRIYRPEEFERVKLEHKNDQVTGIYLFSQTVNLSPDQASLFGGEESKSSFKIHYFETAISGNPSLSGKPIAVVGTNHLDFAMMQVRPGNRISIIYEGRTAIRIKDRTVHVKEYTVTRLRGGRRIR